MPTALAPEPPDGGLGSLLPTRTVGDILAGRVRLRVGVDVIDLPVLPIARNEAWKERLDATMAGLLERATDDADPGQVLDALAADTGPFLDLLYAYDRDGVLPDREVIRETWTELDLLLAVLEVWRAANPLVDVGLGAWSATRSRTPSMPTSASHPSTDGPSPGSGLN